VAHPDLDSLWNSLFPFAQKMLAKRGAFHPFGASIKADGQMAMNAADTGSEHPEPTELVDLLVAGFRQAAAAGSVRAAGVCLDVRVTLPNSSEKSDAICAQLEHAEGQCVDEFLPYKKGLLGRYTFGEVFATPRESRIFGALDGRAGTTPP
jgi:hypothetical protein